MRTADNDNQIETVRRHIARGERILRKQRQFIETLKIREKNTEHEELVLRRFKRIQQEYVDLLKQLEEGGI